tara:strand:- start:200 stop:1588 length:1389 start_codon:yes stop_codon:yes gene_type:complete
MEHPQLYINSNEDTKKIIIQFGTAVFQLLNLNCLTMDEVIARFKSINNNDIDELYQVKIKNLEKTVATLKKDLNSSYETHKNELEGMRDHVKGIYINEINELREQKAMINDKNEKEIEDRINLYRMGANGKIEMADRIAEEKEKRIIALQDENANLTKYINGFIGERSLKDTEKGKYAEDVIKDIFSDCLPFDDEACWKTTARGAGSGDCIIIFSKAYHNLRLMVEMKMKGSITPEDHEQFESHYIDDFNNDKVDLAMMISYDYKNISNQGCCLVHKYRKDNDKVIYFALDKTGTPQEKKEIIIHELHRICKEYIYNKGVVSIPLENNYVCQVEERLKDFKNREISIIKIIKNSKNQLKDFEKEKQTLEKSRNQLLKQLYDDGTIYKINHIYLNENESQLKQMFFHKIKKQMKDKNIVIPPPNKSGKRKPMWRDKLKEELCIDIEPYEKKWWDKFKVDEIMD